jgi:two-component system KDP operon response regulator KdpE
MRILVVEDERKVASFIRQGLEEEGHAVELAADGAEALMLALDGPPYDLIVLDLMLPKRDGFSVLRALRDRGLATPVLVLTARDTVGDKVTGLDLGADDYLAKPFHPDELAARIRSVLRRATGAVPGAGTLAFDDVEIDLERRIVTRDGELVQFSRTEWLLLQHLAANAGKVVLHTELLTKVWGPEYRDDLQYLRVWISRVRRKLGAPPGQPGRIKTFQGIGYLLDVEPTPPEQPADVPVEGPVTSRDVIG